MKKQTSKSLDELAVDVLDYMFVEWLVRCSLYLKFISNLARCRQDWRPPRSIIRDRIREVLISPDLTPSDLISISFYFRCTPEGFRFWSRASCEWASYLESFSKII